MVSSVPRCGMHHMNSKHHFSCTVNQNLHIVNFSPQKNQEKDLMMWINELSTLFICLAEHFCIPFITLKPPTVEKLITLKKHVFRMNLKHVHASLQNYNENLVQSH